MLFELIRIVIRMITSFMNKKLIRHATCFLMLLVLMAPIMVTAQSNFGNEIIENINVPSTNTDLPGIVIDIINIVLGLLALVAIIIVLIGGFEWMTAGGNEDKVATARKRLIYGLIGLVIIFLAYAIVTFVLDKLGGIA